MIIATNTMWLVIEETGEICQIGDTHYSFRDEPLILQAGSTPPHKASSTGRVATNQGEFFPSVIGAKWVPRP